jgi:endonuclease YncB( thermonuclease family)
VAGARRGDSLAKGGLQTALLVLLLCAQPMACAEACSKQTEGESHRVAAVFDGDTLRLADGTVVRLAGIDTPELDHDRGDHQPYAVAARDRLEQSLARAGDRVRLEPAAEGQDHYGRRLAHAYSGDGDNLQALLLAAGLALVTARPPNLANLACYMAAERAARVQRLGLWNELPRSVADAASGPPRFTLVRGRVSRVHRTNKSWWLEIDGRLSLRIAIDDLGNFRGMPLRRLQQREVEARGWVTRHRGRPLLRIRHSAALRVLTEDRGQSVAPAQGAISLDR